MILIVDNTLCFRDLRFKREYLGPENKNLIKITFSNAKDYFQALKILDLKSPIFQCSFDMFGVDEK